MSTAARAYGASRTGMSPRSLEADVFRRVTGALRGASDPVALSRALSDNRRLWMAVEGAVSDPTNALPMRLRADLLSMGRAIAREIEQDAPDVAFLIEMNDNIAAGLGGN